MGEALNSDPALNRCAFAGRNMPHPAIAHSHAMHVVLPQFVTTVAKA